MKIVRYSDNDKAGWDKLVRQSRNGSLLFLRDYMDYHKDRFHDHSLMYLDDHDRLVAVMPGNESGTDYYSHQGLTYGGFVLSNSIHAAQVGELFGLTIEYLRHLGFTTWHYSPVPTIYHCIPAQDDEYWLWRNGAEMEKCMLSASVCMDIDDQELRALQRSRKISYRNQLQRSGYTMKADVPLAQFWPVLTDNLNRTYGAAPVHTLAEMEQLKASFPNNIRCAVAVDDDGAIQAGAVLYIWNGVVHTQYLSATEKGKSDAAMDFLILELIDYYRRSGVLSGPIRYFDMGTSNEDAGRTLNESLINHKEGFGARGVVYKTFAIKL